MSENAEFCRVCLATAIRMVKIAETPLQVVYERLTNSPLFCDNLPVAACYMCYARLCKSHALMESATRATQTLTDLYAANKTTKTAVSQICCAKTFESLTMSQTKFENIEFDASVPTINTAADIDDEPTVQLFEPAVNITDVKPNVHSVDMSAAAFMDVKPAVPVFDVYIPVENGVTPDCVTDVKVEIKEEPLDYDDDDPAGTLNPEIRTASTPRKYKIKTGNPGRSKATNQKKRNSRTAPGEDLVCQVCQQRFQVASELKRHLKKHTNVGPHECKECKSRFKRRVALEKHYKIHGEYKPYTCEVCERQFVHLRYLHKHIQIHNNEKRFECNICKRRFHDKTALKNHCFIHTGEKPHECNHCEKRFNSATTLKRHIMIIHAKDKKYECDVCHRRFVAKYRLGIHLIQHTGDRPYSCDVCGRKFTENYALRKHSLSHTGERPYGCDVCGRRFVYADYLKRHMRIHTKKKPY